MNKKRYQETINMIENMDGKMVKENSFRHFHLYARGWYKKGDFKKDMLKLQETYACCFTDLCDVAGILLNEVHKCIKVNDHLFYKLFDEINPNSIRYTYGNTEGQNYSYWERVCRASLNIMLNTSVEKIDGCLGKPDPDVLELSDDGTRTLKEKEEVKFDETIPTVLIGTGT